MNRETTPRRSGLDLLLSQYRNSPNLIKYIAVLISEVVVLKKVAKDVIKYRQLSFSFGQQVDDIGDLVGRGRVIYGADALGYFGYYDNPQAYTAGDDNNPFIGGVLKGDENKGAGDLVMSDNAYKNAIRARAFKTTCFANTDDVLTYIDLLLGRDVPSEIIEGDLSVNIHVHEVLSVEDKALLSNILPDIKGAGITYSLEDDAGSIDLAFISTDFPAYK